MLGDAVAGQLLAQPLAQAQEVLGLARHGKRAALRIRSHGRLAHAVFASRLSPGMVKFTIAWRCRRPGRTSSAARTGPVPPRRYAEGAGEAHQSAKPETDLAPGHPFPT